LPRIGVAEPSSTYIVLPGQPNWGNNILVWRATLHRRNEMKKSKAQTDKPEEFKRFEDFTRRLMAVPKKEIDQQKAKYEKQKAAKRKKVA
jgi:hypothetical protein